MGIYLRASSQDVNTDLNYVGSRNSSTNSRFFIGNTYHSLKRDGYYFGFNTSTPDDKKPTATVNAIQDMYLNFQNNRKNILNSTEIEDISSRTLDSSNTYPIAVFGANYSGTVQYMSKIKLYKLEISQGSNIIYRFIPAVRNADSAKGLYEIETKTFYTNDGTGSFTVGSTIEQTYSVYKYNGTSWVAV